MKAWLLFAVVLVGCYQPSAAERYNAESEALDRLNAQVERLSKLKGSAEEPSALPAVVNAWNERKSEYDALLKVSSRQAKKVSKMGMDLHQ